MEVFPKRTRDLFAERPVVIHGRYSRAGQGTIRLKGRAAGREIVREIALTLPESAPSNAVIAPVWARAKVEDLMSRDWAAIQYGSPEAGVKSEIVRLGLAYRLMTQFTSFAAVEERHKVEGGRPVLVEVPVETAYGVESAVSFGRNSMWYSAPNGIIGGTPSGVAGGAVGGAIGGIIGNRPGSLPSPPPPPQTDASSRSKLESPLIGLTGSAGGPVAVRVWLPEKSALALADLRGVCLDITESAGAEIFRGKIKPADLLRLASVAAVTMVTRDLGIPSANSS